MRKDVVINDITSAVAALGLMPLAVVGSEVIFDLSFLPEAFYHPGFALGGIAMAFAALAAKAILLRPYVFNLNPFDRYVTEYTR